MSPKSIIDGGTSKHQRQHQQSEKPNSTNDDFAVNPKTEIFACRSEHWRWRAALGILSPRDLFWPLDLSTEWRRHLMWSKRDDGRVLLELVTGRFTSTLTLLSLLFSAEVGTYFSPNGLVTEVRASLKHGPGDDNMLTYMAGSVLIASIIVTASAILANYSALLLFKSVDPVNASVILRSDVGVYAAQLPSRLTVVSIYLFVFWLCTCTNVIQFVFLVYLCDAHASHFLIQSIRFCTCGSSEGLFWWYNFKSVPAGVAVTLTTIVSIGHVVTTFSMLGRIITATSAMGPTPILPKEQEERLTHKELTNALLAEAKIHRRRKIPINKQYRNNKRNLNGADCPYVLSLRQRHPGITVMEDFKDGVENREPQFESAPIV